MMFLGNFDETTPKKGARELTSHHINTFIEGIVKYPRSGFDSKFIDKTLNGFGIPMHIADQEARMLHYANDFFERLYGISYGKIHKSNPKMAVKFLCSNLFPKPLREYMERLVECDKPIKSNVNAFLKALFYEAASWQTHSVRQRSNYFQGAV